MAEGRDLPVGRIRGLRACASARGTFGVLALDHRQNLRKELASGRSRVGHLRRDGRVQAGGRPRARRCRDRGPARPGDRRGPGDRRRLAAGRLRAARGRRGHRLRRAVDGPGQPGARRLERGQGEADGRVGGQAARLLPPGCGQRRRPGAPRGGRRRGLRRGRPAAVRRAVVVLDRPGRGEAGRANDVGGWSSRRPGGSPGSAATS